MRVLHVAEAFSSGILPVVARITEELVAQGHSAAIASGVRPETPADPAAHVAAGVEVFPMPWASRAPREQLRAARALRRLVAEWTPDIVHLHSSFAGGVGAAVLSGGTPRLYTPHGYSFTMSDRSAAARAAFRTAERLIARRVDLVAAISESEAALAREVARAPRVAVVPNGIPELDAPDLREKPPAGRPRVVAVGRISAPRPPGPAAEILGALTAVADVAWLGAETEGTTGTALLERAGIPVSGWLPRQEVLARLGGAAACLHWSTWDGLPISVLEALALDVPVVASDIPANREILGPGAVCRTPAQAAALLHAAVTDPAVRAELLSAQRERRGRFGAARMASEWIMLYTRTLQEPTPAAENRL